MTAQNRFETALRTVLAPRRVQVWRDTSGYENAETWEVDHSRAPLGFEIGGRLQQPYHRDPIFTPFFLYFFTSVGLWGTSLAVATGIATSLATTAIISGIGYLLAPKPPKPEDIRQPLLQPIPYRYYVVGEARTAGSFLLWDSKGDKMVSVQGIAGHRIQGYKTYYLHDDIVTIDGLNRVTPIDDKYGGPGAVKIYPRVGLVPEVAIADFVSLLSADGVYTENSRCDGQATIGMQCISASQKKQPKRFPSGLPVLAPVVEGALVWDPRNPAQSPEDPSTWAYSKNSALIFIWHQCFNPFGERRDYRRAILPVLDMYKEEADVCDEEVPKASGGTEKRYECCGVDRADNDPKSGTNAILATCDGWMIERGDGALLFVVGKFREKYCGELTDADITGHRIERNVLPEDECNKFTPKFTYPATDYTTTDTDYFEDLEAQAISGVLPLEGNYLWVQQWRQARRLGKREFLRRRQKIRGGLDVRFTGINAAYLPWIRMNAPRRLPSLQGKVILNRGVKLSIMKGGFQMSWVLMPGTGPEIDAWDPATDEGLPPPVPFKPSTVSIPKPVIDDAVIVTSETSVKLRVYIIDPNRPDLITIVRYRTSDEGAGAGSWLEREYPDLTPAGGLLVVDTDNVPNGVTLDVEAAFKGTAGSYGPWSDTEVVYTYELSHDFSRIGNSQFHQDVF